MHCRPLADLVQDDLLVVNAARVSMSKYHERFEGAKDERLLRYLYKHNHWTPFAHAQLAFRRVITETDLWRWLYERTPGCETHVEVEPAFPKIGAVVERGSLWFWIKNRHLLTPIQQEFVGAKIAERFPHTAKVCGIAQKSYPVLGTIVNTVENFSDAWVVEDISRANLPWFTFHLCAPVAIRTQCFKHKFGFVENEVSRRYVSDTPNVFLPTWRERAESVKQGSGCNHPDQSGAGDAYRDSCYNALDSYDKLVRQGYAPEQARFVLPQGTETEWLWTGSLAAFARVCRQRSDEHAQQEIQELVEPITHHLATLYPESFDQLMEQSQ